MAEKPVDKRKAVGLRPTNRLMMDPHVCTAKTSSVEDAPQRRSAPKEAQLYRPLGPTNVGTLHQCT